MAKGRWTGSFSRLLYVLGNAIHFAPDSAYAPPRSEKEGKEKWETQRERFVSRIQKAKSALAKMCEQSFFLGMYKAFVHAFFTVRVRSFGVLFFSCGFLQILSYFLGGYLPFAVGDESNLIFGVTSIFFTLLCSFTRGSVADVLKKSFLYRGFLVPLFGGERWELPTGRGGDNFFGMLLMGALLAFFSVIFTPVSVFSVLLLLALILFIFYQPEAGLTVIAMALFSVSFDTTLFLTGVTLAAFLCKVAVGKRTVVCSLRDGVVFLALFPVLFCRNGFRLFFVLAVLYLVSLGLLRTLAGIRKLLGALTLGSLFCAGMLVTRFLVTTFFGTLPVRFPNLESLLFLKVSEQTLALMAMACPVALGLFRSVKRTTGVILSPWILLLFTAAVFTGASVPLWIALLAALAVQNLMTYRFAMIWYVTVGLSLMIALNFIPPEWVTWAVSVFGFASSSEPAAGGFAGIGIAPFTGFFLLFALTAYFIYAVVRFALRSTRPLAFPRVLGAVGGVVALVALGIGGVAMDERALMLFVILVALPRASEICSKREEIRLPY